MGLAIKREKAAVGPEKGLPEASLDVGSISPGEVPGCSSFRFLAHIYLML